MEPEKKPPQDDDEPKKKRIMPIIIIIVIIILLGIIALTSKCNCNFSTGNENENVNANENANKGTTSQAVGFGLSFTPSKLKVGLTSVYKLRVSNHSEGNLTVENLELTWYNGETEVSKETVDQTSANWLWQGEVIAQDQEEHVYQEEKPFNEVGTWLLKAKVNTNKGTREIEGDVEVHSGEN